MNVGLCSWAFARSAAGRRNVVELAQIAASAGFTSLEGAYNPRGTVSLNQPPPDRLSIPIASLATLEFHRFSWTSPHESHRKQANEAVEAMLRCAAAWGIPSISFSPGAVQRGEDRSARLRVVARDLVPHAELAARLGVTLALENLPNHLLASRADMAFLLKELPGAGLCLDVGNALVDPPLGAWYDELGDRIVKVHLSDARVSEGRWSPAWPGSGELDWNDVRRLLADARSDHVFVEVLWDGESEDAAFTARIANSLGGLLKN